MSPSGTGDGRPADDLINAYVDGELSPEDAALVAYAAARDGETAARIAEIAKLKSVMPGLVADPDIDLPPAGRPRRRVRLAAALAACVALIAALGAAGVVMTSPASWQEIAVERHAAWSESVDAGDAAALRPAAATTGTTDFRAPDLSAARLTLRLAETIERDGRRARHFAYTGTRGCRVSLFVFPDADAGTAPSDLDGTMQAAGWAARGHGFLLIAAGMDPRHFDTIRRAVERYSLNGTPLTRTARSALTNSRRQARPCSA